MVPLPSLTRVRAANGVLPGGEGPGLVPAVRAREERCRGVHEYFRASEKTCSGLGILRTAHAVR